jgi:hypothetical protein
MHVRFERWKRRRRFLTSVAAASAVAGLVASVALGDPRPPVLKAGNPGGIVFARGSAHGNGHGPGGGGGGKSSPDLKNHGGNVLVGTIPVSPVYWGSSWGSYTGDKIDGLERFYSNVGASVYLTTTSEYSGATGSVTHDLRYSGPLYDNSKPARAPSTSDVVNAVKAALGPTPPTAYGYYPVYSDQPRGGANYCAWHTWATIGTTPIEIAFFFNLDNDSGCDVSDPYSSTISAGLASLGNVSGHELSETLTDPQLNAWYDSSGAENADKCAWTFSSSAVQIGSDSWKIQGNWSNNSYDKHTPLSYLGSGSGCIDGNQ